MKSSAVPGTFWEALDPEHKKVVTCFENYASLPNRERRRHLAISIFPPICVFFTRILTGTLLHKQRIKNWRDAIYAQLDATGLFTPKEASVPA